MKQFIIVSIIFVIAVLVIVFPAQKTRHVDNDSPKEIITQTWGWAKVVSKPTLVVVPEQPTSWFMQVEFQISEPEIFSALIINQKMFFPLPSSWKKGDEVLIANFPGKQRSVPSRTYLVVGYRPQSDERSSESSLVFEGEHNLTKDPNGDKQDGSTLVFQGEHNMTHDPAGDK